MIVTNPVWRARCYLLIIVLHIYAYGQIILGSLSKHLSTTSGNLLEGVVVMGIIFVFWLIISIAGIRAKRAKNNGLSQRIVGLSLLVGVISLISKDGISLILSSKLIVNFALQTVLLGGVISMSSIAYVTERMKAADNDS
ncbi:MAG: hypothetical protein OEZ02_06355 [Anaerolineae bacterium]|nr:hypothetical protein [Anaerolineae bacterium]